MIVTWENFDKTLAALRGKRLAIDTETTGLRPYHGDEFFSLILHDGDEGYYLNFGEYPEITAGDPRLLGPEHLAEIARFFAEPGWWALHSAKFDLAMLAQHGIHLTGQIHDTMVTARVLDSTLWGPQFSLDHLGQEIGEKKGDAPKAWCLANKAFTEVIADGKKQKKKLLHFSRVPWDVIVPYGLQDGLVTWRLAERQLQRLQEQETEQAAVGVRGSVRAVYENECELVKTTFAMERLGVQVDLDFCRRAAAAARATLATAADEFQRLAGEPFKDSSLVYQRAFESDRERWVMGEVTPTGKQNPSFDSDVLETFDHPAARQVLAWRKAKSDVNYYLGFLDAADKGGVIHANLNQHIPVTGRFSSSEPNLQNLTKDEDEKLAAEFVVRRAIVPREGLVLHMLDFAQMEYRLMLDYAARFAGYDKDGVLALVAKVQAGLDVHQATADLAGISRREAKTVNFAILYGSGLTLLANRLNVTERRAREIRDSIFTAAPEINTLIRRVMAAAEKRGWVSNWMGRLYRFPDARFAYRAPNYLIQGGCADVVKLAMNQTAAFLQPFRTRMVLCIHDEIVLEGPPAEAAEVVPVVREIMEKAYPHRFLALSSDVEHSFKSLADKEEGIARA